MFDQLSDRLQSTLSEVRSRGKLSESDVDAAMREIRLALLEADVNFKVVKSFTRTLKERCLGAEVMDSLDPGQQVVKIVNEELAELMGGSGEELAMAASGPTVILMSGLQGSGKTTACAKLAQYFRKQNKDVAFAACDVYRPAAVDQLVTMGQRAGAHVYQQGTDADPVAIAEWALEQAQTERRDVLIVDTAGRLHIDQDLMSELTRIRKKTRPHDVLLVVDAMTGQDAVGVAESFAEAAEFDGVARGGAALSVKAVTGKPILFASTGEKLEDFDKFHPDRMAQRILGMGDVLTLIEQAEQAFDEDQKEKMTSKLLGGEQFTLEDFLDQLVTIRRMGPIANILGMMPGMGQMKDQLAELDDSHFDRVTAIIRSMTPGERQDPKIINGSRRARIARGSGVAVMDVNQLLNRFAEAQKMMKQMGPMMGLPGRRKATKSPKNKRKGTKGGNRPRLGGLPGGFPGGMPALPPGLDPSALDPNAGFKPPKLDFNKLNKG